MKSTNYLARFFCTLLCTFIGISAAFASNTAENKHIISGIDFLTPRVIVVPYAGKTIETTAKLIVANLNNGDVANSTKANNNANTDAVMIMEAKIVACQPPACTPVTITKTKSL